MAGVVMTTVSYLQLMVKTQAYLGTGNQQKYSLFIYFYPFYLKDPL